MRCLHCRYSTYSVCENRENTRRTILPNSSIPLKHGRFSMAIELETQVPIGTYGLRPNQRNGMALKFISLFRTAFFLFIMDSGLVTYFGDRPSIPVYEIRHTIQCHEAIWSAGTAAEWADRRRMMPVNDSEFPLMMSMLISPDIPVPPPNISVLGGFCLLHGL